MERFLLTPDQFHPKLVHRILLVDDENLPNLTLSGETKRSKLSFSTFSQNHGYPASSTSIPSSNLAEQIANNMRRAFFDQMYHKIKNENDYSSFANMLLELHTGARKLVPRRTDLHCILNDESIQKENLKQNESAPELFLKPLIDVGEALVELESPDQVDATSQWLEIIRKKAGLSRDDGNMSTESYFMDMDLNKFAILSTAFLIEKTNFCQMDIKNEHLRQYIAPMLRKNNNAMGVSWEQYYFQKQYGKFDTFSANYPIENKTLPKTRAWIQQVALMTPNLLTNSKLSKVQILLQKGIVESILFSNSTKPTPLPEIFLLDTQSLLNIRRVVQLSVTGSALALHCCAASGITTVLGENNTNDFGKTHDLLSLECLQKERSILTKAMAKGKGKEGNEMTPMLEEAILSLVNALIYVKSFPSDRNTIKASRGALNENEKEMLLNRSTGVLRGTDPVFKLLDKRIRTFFASAMIWNSVTHDDDITNTLLSSISLSSPTQIPSNMQTGHRPKLKPLSSQNVHTHNDHGNKKWNFIKSTVENARMNGFSIYAHDLAYASWDLRRIGDHIVSVFWDVLLAKLIMQTDQNNNRD